jgi:sec-independent protein translocase protein TatA
MEPIEIIFVLAILLFIFGPEKLPVLARQLGEAVSEFRKASSGVTPGSRSENTVNVRTELESVAQKLGIKTEGKTIRQLGEEIKAKIEAKTSGSE